VNAARAFYADVLGAQFWGLGVSLAPLPERAAAMGAPAHWLGHIGTGDVELAASRIVAAGGQRLGPSSKGPDGSSVAVLRDPFGAVMAVGSDTSSPPPSAVAWHFLHVNDHESAFAAYADLFGWTATALVDLDVAIGRQQLFAWDDSGESVGGVTDMARQPHIHAQWMFCFRVANLEDARVKVLAHGGTVAEPTRTPNGDLVAACEDAQRAAFALLGHEDTKG
jgi:predicted enzyme related to lactoylglutathione lyase